LHIRPPLRWYDKQFRILLVISFKRGGLFLFSIVAWSIVTKLQRLGKFLKQNMRPPFWWYDKQFRILLVISFKRGGLFLFSIVA
jgi:hypothetical protein